MIVSRITDRRMPIVHKEQFSAGIYHGTSLLLLSVQQPEPATVITERIVETCGVLKSITLCCLFIVKPALGAARRHGARNARLTGQPRHIFTSLVA